MKKIFIILFSVISIVVQAQYNPHNGQVFNNPMAPATPIPSDMRSYYYDGTNFIFRRYQSTSEILSYLNSSAYRTGNFQMYVCTGTLSGNGIFTGGQTFEYMFRNGVADSNLVLIGIDPTQGNNGLTYNFGFLQLGGNLLHSTDIEIPDTSSFTINANNTVDQMPAAYWYPGQVAIYTNTSTALYDAIHGFIVNDPLSGSDLSDTSVQAMRDSVQMSITNHGFEIDGPSENQLFSVWSWGNNASPTTYVYFPSLGQSDTSTFVQVLPSGQLINKKIYHSTSEGGYFRFSPIDSLTTRSANGIQGSGVSIVPQLANYTVPGFMPDSSYAFLDSLHKGLIIDTTQIVYQGTGHTLLRGSGTELLSKTLVAGTNITITPGTDSSLTINSSGGGGSGGIFRISPIDSAGIASVNGLTVSGVNIVPNSASATDAGLVNTTTQAFAGIKTFNSLPVLGTSTVTSGYVPTATGTSGQWVWAAPTASSSGYSVIFPYGNGNTGIPIKGGDSAYVNTNLVGKHIFVYVSTISSAPSLVEDSIAWVMNGSNFNIPYFRFNTTLGEIILCNLSNDSSIKNGQASFSIYGGDQGSYANIDNGTALTPTLTVSPTSITGMTDTAGSVGTPEMFTVSGTNLTSNPVVTAPTNFSVSLNDITFTSSVTLTESGGTLASTRVWVQIANTAPAGSIGPVNVTAAATGATTKNVAVSGTVVSSSLSAIFRFSEYSSPVTGTTNVFGAPDSVATSFTDATTGWAVKYITAGWTKFDGLYYGGVGNGADSASKDGVFTMPMINSNLYNDAPFSTASYGLEIDNLPAGTYEITLLGSLPEATFDSGEGEFHVQFGTGSDNYTIYNPQGTGMYGYTTTKGNLESSGPGTIPSSAAAGSTVFGVGSFTGTITSGQTIRIAATNGSTNPSYTGQLGVISALKIKKD